jgi:hypothetical protein
MLRTQHFNIGDLAVYRLTQRVPHYERSLRANLPRHMRVEMVVSYVAVGTYVPGLILGFIAFSNDLEVAGVVAVALVIIGFIAMILSAIVSAEVRRISGRQEKLKAGKLRDKYVTSNDASYSFAFAEHGKLRHPAYETAIFLENALVNETDRKLHAEVELDLDSINEHYEMKQVLVKLARSYFGNSASVQALNDEAQRERSELIGKAKDAHRAELEEKELAFQAERDALVAKHHATMKPVWERGKQFSKI